MIYWKDFVLDDVIGPSLVVGGEEEQLGQSCRKANTGILSVQDDAEGTIQETGQGQRPARMAGLSSLDSVQTGMEAGQDHPSSTWQGEER